ncbi:hypothetical protein Nepgr_025897 [Nepenthes gracilis]|uniref:LOB domain-containing protein n=1 Tax=Nepenthes gracilis TaxID=150966 RepID=A0AAD3T7D0_NEPGR|nr:hypothetical protein Nepgr_025897 [Nepenthes gracilis]
MSCNGCRILRKGCSESCALRPCLQWIESPEAQGYATVFVAKFFGRAGLMSFVSNVPESQRPALFQSLLYEACGRTVNPVNGAVGLLWTGNWHICQAAVETILRGGSLRPIPEFLNGIPSLTEADEASEVMCPNIWKLQDPNSGSNSPKRKRAEDQKSPKAKSAHLDLSLTPPFPASAPPPPHQERGFSANNFAQKQKRPATPSRNSEESVTTIMSFENSGLADHQHPKLLNLFV